MLFSSGEVPVGWRGKDPGKEPCLFCHCAETLNQVSSGTGGIFQRGSGETRRMNRYKEAVTKVKESHKRTGFRRRDQRRIPSETQAN